ncbi:MAG: ATP-binding cassette domain-containing protein [Rhodopseudomonas sp.]|nr:ATP-binding cassette domain-containing protein [Rhodopseudomonas sp.]
MSSIPVDAETKVGAAPDLAAAARAQDLAVRLDGVTKRFGNTVALNDAWLQVRRGEFLTLLGPSGCGKTTMLNLVAGFLFPDNGEVFIDGALVTDVPTYEREIGIVFQNYALFPHMTVASNVGYGLKARGVAQREIAERVTEILAMMKLAGLEDRKPGQLSGGQQQRVALARALVIRPKVLLLDEPFSALDKNLRSAMQIEVKEIQRKLGVTTIFVTHDQSEALSLSDRIAVVSEGKIRQIGTPQEIYRRPANRFIASFIGEVSVLRARLERIEKSEAVVQVGAASITVPAGPLAGQSPGITVDLFVRPEQLCLASGDVALEGQVATTVYQGDHVDLYIDAPAAASTRILMRLPSHDRVPGAGATIGLAIGGHDATAFPAVES